MGGADYRHRAGARRARDAVRGERRAAGVSGCTRAGRGDSSSRQWRARHPVALAGQISRPRRGCRDARPANDPLPVPEFRSARWNHDRSCHTRLIVARCSISRCGSRSHRRARHADPGHRQRAHNVWRSAGVRCLARGAACVDDHARALVSHHPLSRPVRGAGAGVGRARQPLRRDDAPRGGRRDWIYRLGRRGLDRRIRRFRRHSRARCRSGAVVRAAIPSVHAAQRSVRLGVAL